MHRRVMAALVGLAVAAAPVPAAAEPVEPVPPAPSQPWAATPPGPEPPAVAAPDTGAVASGPPGVAETPEGATLTVAGDNETQLPIPPLTTSLSSRDWLVGGTFIGTTEGSATGGTLEVGYQIGCGVEMNQVRLGGTLGGNVNSDSLAIPMQGAIDVRMRPGTVVNAPVMTKEFSGTKTRVIVKDIHVRVDGCVGQSNLRSYAILATSTANTEDIVAYYGLPKVF